MKVPNFILPAFADDNQLREPCPSGSVTKLPPRTRQPLDPVGRHPLRAGMLADYGILVINPEIGSASSVVDPMQLRWKVL